jgi:hypothetical protein
MSDGGKGSRPRPFSVNQQTFSSNWDNIFKKDKQMQVKADANNDIGSCGCGRSPTGKCVGWHGLTEEAYKHAHAQWIEEQFRKDAEADEQAK